ncbi:MAG: L,D-transpeptidase [Alsobacter sp.]
MAVDGVTRRGMLTGVAGLGAAVLLPWHGPARSDEITEIEDLKPGEFTWHPERSPEGPVAVVASIPEQLVHVYRNGIRIAVSTCSTGAPGHETPTGVFVVLQKDKNHRSSTYNDAPMPNMNRLTWGGIALHAGKLPGYPASHGCVRLPLAFSAKLFEVTHLGTPVIIAGAHTDPWELVHPGLVLGGYAEDEFEGAVANLKGKSLPLDWAEGQTQPVTSVIASSADRSLTLVENGNVVATGTLTLKGDPPLGEHVLVLRGSSDPDKGLAWRGISHQPDPSQPDAPEASLIQRLSGDPAFIKAMSGRMHPGMVFIVTDLPSHPDQQTGSDFVIMSQT